MSSGSFRDAVKALNTTFSAPTVPNPLPEELSRTIEAFLDRYQSIDDHDSQRLQDELLPLYKKYVVDDPEKLGPFLSALRQLRPAIRGEARLTEWWNTVIRPTIDAIGHKRDEIEDAREFLLGILVFDSEDDASGEKAQLSATFTKKLLDAYLQRTKLPRAEGEVIRPEDEFVAHELESILILFGRKKPKEILMALDELFVTKEHRAQALSLLSSFVRIQPPHLYLVLETLLFQHLEKCLMTDASATVIELALTVLIMFLPHITGSLVSHLPRLFLIYSRILCWDQIIQEVSEDQDGESDNKEDSPYQDAFAESEADLGWEKLPSSRIFDNKGCVAPGLLHYFTFLYGLFPLNFTSFIRNPRKWLKKVEFPGAEDFDLNKDMMRSRTEPFHQVHLLHPNFFTTTWEDELDETRWLKSDPADVVTECMGLCLAVSATLDDPGPPPSSRLPDVPELPAQTREIPADAVLSLDETTSSDGPQSPSGLSRRNTQTTLVAPPTEWQLEPMPIGRKVSTGGPGHPTSKSSTPSSPVTKAQNEMDSPTIPPLNVESELAVQQPQAHSPQTMHKGSTPSAPPSRGTAFPLLESFVQFVSQNNTANSPTRVELNLQNTTSLQREVMLLRNDLNFERYLKHQQLAHIGQLQRKHIKEVTAEAETQKLINTNRTLKAKLAKANELYTQLKKETVTGRNQSKKWEGELSSKVRSFREEQKQWLGEEETLRRELQKAQQDCERLRKLVVDSEARELNAKYKLHSLELNMEELNTLRRQNMELQGKVRDLEIQCNELRGARDERDALRNDLEMVNMQMRSRDADRDRARRSYEAKIAELESHLHSSERNVPLSPGQLTPSVQQMIDNAVRATDARLKQLKKTHNHLLDKYTDLEMKCHELESELEVKRGRHHAFGSRGMTNDSTTSSLGRQSSVASSGIGGYASRFPQTHAFSEPNRADDDEYYNDYGSPSSSTSPTTIRYPNRPVRLESLQQRDMHREAITPIENYSGAYESSLSPTFQRSAQGSTQASGASSSSHMPQSSAKSAYSVESGESSKGDKSAKIQPKSEVRVYGRGGAQNIGKKKKETTEKKDKEKEKEKQQKSGAFRGLRNFV